MSFVRQTEIETGAGIVAGMYLSSCTLKDPHLSPIPHFPVSILSQYGDMAWRPVF